jgi:hypothetical protein
MSIFDLVFLIAALTGIVSLLVAIALFLGKRRKESLRVLRAVAFGLATYLAVSVLVSFARPQRLLAEHTPWCFDDWCLSVKDVQETRSNGQLLVTVHLILSSTALRVDQRALGGWIYLMDEKGQRYAPLNDRGNIPLDVLLAPGEERSVQRRFQLPDGRHPAGLLTGHGGSYCGLMSLLIIGNGACMFDRPKMIGLAT